MKVKALQRFPYEGKQREIGDEFDIPVEIHAKIMEHRGDVAIVKDDEPKKAEPPKEQPRPVETRAIKAEDSAPAATNVGPMTTENTPELAAPTKRTYKRRDMKPES